MNKTQKDKASTGWMMIMTGLIVLSLAPSCIYSLDPSYLAFNSAFNSVMLALIFGCAVALIFQKRKAAKTYGIIMLVVCAIAFLGSFVVRVR